MEKRFNAVKRIFNQVKTFFDKEGIEAMQFLDELPFAPLNSRSSIRIYHTNVDSDGT